MTLHLPGSSRRKWTPQSPRAVQPRLRCRPTARPGYRQKRTSRGNATPPTHPPLADSPAPATRPKCACHYRVHPGDAHQEGVKVGLQLRERDDRTGNRGEHVLNQRDDVRPHQEGVKVGLQLRERDDRTGNRGEHVLNQRADVRPQQEGVKVGLQLRARDDRTGNRGAHVLNQRADVRNRRDRSGGQRRRIGGRRDRIGGRRPPDQGPAPPPDQEPAPPPDQGPAPPPDQEPAPPPDQGPRRRRIGNRGDDAGVVRSSAASVPPGSLLGLFAPVEGWPEAWCRQARYSGYSRRWRLA